MFDSCIHLELTQSNLFDFKLYLEMLFDAANWKHPNPVEVTTFASHYLGPLKFFTFGDGTHNTF